MCISTEALMLFLSLLNPEIVDRSGKHVIVRAEVREARWVHDGEEWCTLAPQIDAQYRLAPGA